MSLDELNREVAKHNLASGKILPIGQLRIATMPPAWLTAACRNRPPLTDAQLAEFTAPIGVLPSAA